MMPITPKIKSVTCLLLACAALSSCNATNQQVGGAGGAVAGGVIGNQFGKGNGRLAATAVGALAGGLIGSGVGQRLDDNSRQQALGAQYNALETGQAGQPVNWQGANGTYGTVTPQQTYQVGSQNCRRYTHTIFVDGLPQEASGSACRNPDGSWTPLT